jgi:hypothetical protein
MPQGPQGGTGIAQYFAQNITRWNEVTIQAQKQKPSTGNR